MKPSLGVLIAYYNEGEFLTTCLNSLLDGSEPPDEILIYDDGSTLPPDAFIPPGASVRVIRGAQNCGLGFSRNVLLRESQTEYIHFHDPDDWFYRDWCARMHATIETRRADLVLTEMTILDANRCWFCNTDMLRGLHEGSDLTRFAILTCIASAQSTFVRALGLAMGGFRTRDMLTHAEDCDFHIRLAHAASCLTVIHEPAYFYWLRAGSLSRQDDHARADGLICGIRSSELLAGEMPEQYRGALAERIMRRAVKLYALGYRDEARKGTAVARRLAPTSAVFGFRRYPVRAVTSIFGLEATSILIERMRTARQTLRSFHPRGHNGA